MRRSFDRAFALGLCVGIAGALAASEGGGETRVTDSSRTLPGGERVLEQSIVVTAEPEEVWAAFTTGEGFASWAAPVTAVDFRLGGIVESSYRLGGELGAAENIKNEIVAYVPHRMLAFRNVQAPPVTRFDVETFQRLHTVVLIEPVGAEATKVTLVQPGYLPGEPYEGVYRHFEWGNRWSLEKLVERFETGPIDWPSVLGGASPEPETR